MVDMTNFICGLNKPLHHAQPHSIIANWLTYLFTRLVQKQEAGKHWYIAKLKEKRIIYHSSQQNYLFKAENSSSKRRSGQSARLSPLRLRVRFLARTQCSTQCYSSPVLYSCEKSQSNGVNTLPKVVGFVRALRFPPTGKLTGWVRTQRKDHTEV